MGKLYVDTLEPQSGTSLAVGESGQNMVIGGNTIKLNVLQDAGGNAIFTSNGSGTLSGVNSEFGGGLTLIQSQTASSVADVTFSSGIDTTYKVYEFRWYNVASATADANFEFQANTSYNQVMTTNAYRAFQAESNAAQAFGYVQSDDQEQGTAYQRLIEGGGMPTEADASCCGILTLFSPGSTTYVKQFMTRAHQMKLSGGQYYSIDSFFTGYFNTTTALDKIQFKFSSGNISAGTIKMFGMG
tara:strand:- start:1302 stop:2030 length:729 start_codon:yes stop_codon:yes gene_type:complete